jgi:hypothetical protein
LNLQCVHDGYVLTTLSVPFAVCWELWQAGGASGGVLLETLASKLPPGTISFSSKLKSIAEQGPDGTLLELEDGRQILSKVSEKGPLSKLSNSLQIQRSEMVNAA